MEKTTQKPEEDKDKSATFSAKQKKSKTEQTEEKETQEFKLSYAREHAIGYLLRKMPYNYMVHKRILSELKNRLPDFKPKTCLDYGAGLGSGLWAAQHIYGPST